MFEVTRGTGRRKTCYKNSHPQACAKLNPSNKRAAPESVSKRMKKQTRTSNCSNVFEKR